jgi:hypothetical protein
MSRLCNSTNSIVQCGTPAKLANLPSTGVGFSACMWIFRTADGTASQPRAMNNLNNAGTLGWSFYPLKSTQTPANSLQYAEARATTARVRTSVANVISNNVWTFIALTVANSNLATDVHIYKGLPAGQVAEVSYTTPTQNGSGTYNSDSALHLCFGTKFDNAGANFFTGDVAEARVYGNYILSLNELQGIMNGNISIPNPTLYTPIWGLVSTPDVDLSASTASIGCDTPRADPPPTNKTFALYL